MSATIRIGTRGSQLALWQANEVARRLTAAGHRTEIRVVRTTGDKRQDVTLASVGGKGVFIKELEEALSRGEIDIAVHSLKDVPSIVPNDYELAAFLDRADPRDAWVQLEGIPIADLPRDAKIATSAPRRRAQLRALFPHLRIEEIRGNVDTRINKLRAGLYAGAILACAGLHRLGRDAEITGRFSIDEMVPAAGQGIIAIETLAGRGAAVSAVLNHERTALAAKCERGVLQKFGDLLDCYSAVAVHATVEDTITIRAFFGEIDGERTIRFRQSGKDAESLIDGVYEALIAAGANDLAVRRTPLTEGRPS